MPRPRRRPGPRRRRRRAVRWPTARSRPGPGRRGAATGRGRAPALVGPGRGADARRCDAAQGPDRGRAAGRARRGARHPRSISSRSTPGARPPSRPPWARPSPRSWSTSSTPLAGPSTALRAGDVAGAVLPLTVDLALGPHVPGPASSLRAHVRSSRPAVERCSTRLLGRAVVDGRLGRSRRARRRATGGDRRHPGRRPVRRHWLAGRRARSSARPGGAGRGAPPGRRGRRATAADPAAGRVGGRGRGRGRRSAAGAAKRRDENERRGSPPRPSAVERLGMPRRPTPPRRSARYRDPHRRTDRAADPDRERIAGSRVPGSRPERPTRRPRARARAAGSIRSRAATVARRTDLDVRVCRGRGAPHACSSGGLAEIDERLSRLRRRAGAGGPSGCEAARVDGHRPRPAGGRGRDRLRSVDARARRPARAPPPSVRGRSGAWPPGSTGSAGGAAPSEAELEASVRERSPPGRARRGRDPAAARAPRSRQCRRELDIEPERGRWPPSARCCRTASPPRPGSASSNGSCG